MLTKAAYNYGLLGVLDDDVDEPEITLGADRVVDEDDRELVLDPEMARGADLVTDGLEDIDEPEMDRGLEDLEPALELFL